MSLLHCPSCLRMLEASIDPPLVLWSIDKGAFSLEAFSQGEHFAVNVLRNDQVDISNRFARRGEDKFAGLKIGIVRCGVTIENKDRKKTDASSLF